MSKIENLFGYHSSLALLKNHPEQVVEVFLQGGRQDKRMSEIAAYAERAAIPVQQVGRKKLDVKAAEHSHQGVWLRYRPRPPLSDNNLAERLQNVGPQTWYLLLDSITDPHNLGACLRTADAVGVDGVIVAKDKSSTLTPVVRKVASGAAESVSFFQVTNLARTIAQMQEAGIYVSGTALTDTARPLYGAELTGPTALVMGAEGKGLRRLTAERCDQLLYLPMQGSVDSLNVAVATGVFLYEILRQRSSA